MPNQILDASENEPICRQTRIVCVCGLILDWRTVNLSFDDERIRNRIESSHKPIGKNWLIVSHDQSALIGFSISNCVSMLMYLCLFEFVSLLTRFERMGWHPLARFTFTLNLICALQLYWFPKFYFSCVRVFALILFKFSRLRMDAGDKTNVIEETCRCHLLPPTKKPIGTLLCVSVCEREMDENQSDNSIL